ncbi:hypothetical protein UA08_03623 [Talaromyces atroroseus]|uniref:ABM domain-containing protein n=1 Tax=Talaromyces atroroseus TaxID=1441469 RepID=A0A225AV76_TALAT|nr:hypothetical protein UA08_03623 [Talaromyces atroroseus]OKL61208.1 hypothetical protein UA08_03623 [Talaromyces atroroseus]
MSQQYVHLVAIATVKEGQLEKLLEEVKKITEVVHNTEPDILRYYCIQTKNAKGLDQIIFVEKYTTEEAFKAHTASAHFQAFAGKFSEFLAEPLDIKVGSFIAGHEVRASL